MKDNTKRILTWLYEPKRSSVDQGQSQYSQSIQTSVNIRRQRQVEKTGLRWLCPELSDAGFRSLIFLLQKKQLIRSIVIGSLSLYSLTDHGRKALETEFPALCSGNSNWQGNWSLLLFLQAPKGDANFRYLREVLLKEKTVALGRGMFLSADGFSTSLITMLESMYVGSVIVIKVNEWLFGDQLQVIGQKIGLQDTIHIYSEISKEARELIRKIEVQNSTVEQYKDQVFSLYDRFLSALKNDFGLCSYYAPQVGSITSLLSLLQNELAMG